MGFSIFVEICFFFNIRCFKVVSIRGRSLVFWFVGFFLEGCFFSLGRRKMNFFYLFLVLFDLLKEFFNVSLYFFEFEGFGYIWL